MPFKATAGPRRGSKVYTSGDGFYYFYRSENNSKSHYVCYKQNCDARVYVLRGEDVERAHAGFCHFHPPEPLLAEQFILRENILNRVEREGLPLKKIFDEECNR